MNIKSVLSDVMCFFRPKHFFLSHTANISSLSASCLSPEHTVKKRGLCRQPRLHKR